MLYNLLVPLTEFFAPFNLLSYLTFRSGAALVTALAFSLLFGARFIAFLKRHQANGQPIRNDGPNSHQAKQGTPTMGGVLLLVSLIVSTLLWADWRNPYIWIVLAIALCYGTIGFVDDLSKVRSASARGVTWWLRLLLEASIAIAAALLIARLGPSELSFRVAFPFFKDFLLYLGPIFFSIFAVFVITGSANGVNFSDGLDGLAIVLVMIVAASFALIAYLIGNRIFADYLQVHYVSGSGELAIVCAALIGAGLGFLWYNAHPAQVFMGDTGALAIGGIIGATALITRHELVLLIIGGIFVAEVVSVALQVGSYRLTGKRVFMMAPLHHHFEQKGIPETRLVMRLWIIASVLALIGLSTLKIR